MGKPIAVYLYLFLFRICSGIIEALNKSPGSTIVAQLSRQKSKIFIMN